MELKIQILKNNKKPSFTASIKVRLWYVILVTCIVVCYSCEFEEITIPVLGENNKISISTLEVSETTQYSAKVSGLIEELYGRQIQDYGHCWDIESIPDTSDSLSSHGILNNSITYYSDLSNLSINTVYYVRAYFIIDDIVVYGNEIYFQTLPPGPPIIQTDSVYGKTETTVNCAYTLISDGGSPVFRSGVCCSTKPTPSLNDTNIIRTMDNSAVDLFPEEHIIGLSKDSTYYIRAYAINSADTAYGNDLTFTTLTN